MGSLWRASMLGFSLNPSQTWRALKARLDSIRIMRQALVNPGWRRRFCDRPFPAIHRSTLRLRKVGKAGDGLFDGSDAAHHFGALLQQLTQLFVSCAHSCTGH